MAPKSTVYSPAIRTLLRAFQRKLEPELQTDDSPYTAFQHRYFNDAKGFVHECFFWKTGEAPTLYQDEALDGLLRYRRLSYRGPHGLGKTAMMAWLVHWFALTRDGLDWKIPTTAGSNRQLYEYLWPEIHKWSFQLDWSKIGRRPYGQYELMTTKLRLRTGSAFAVASSDHQLMEGAHADHILYGFDEAKAIPDATFDAAEGALSNDSGASTPASHEALAFMISTPGIPNGRFYEVQTQQPGFEDWAPRHVSHEEVIAAGRMSPTWMENRRRQWGENSAVFRNRVLGQFAASMVDALIDLAWVEASNDLHAQVCRLIEAGETELGEPIVVSGDIADGGTDKTVLAARYEVEHEDLGGVVHFIDELHYYTHSGVMKTAGKLVRLLRRCSFYRKWFKTGESLDLDNLGGDENAFFRGLRKATRAIVDAMGVGAGVYDRIRELGYRIWAYKGGSKSTWKDRTRQLEFTNLRSAGYWHLREWLDPEDPRRLALPHDDVLTGDLTAPTWAERSDGRIQVEPKEKIKKRLNRSTDAGDCVMMNLAIDLVKGKKTLGLEDNTDDLWDDEDV